MAQTSVTIPTDARTQATPTLYNRLVDDATELYGRMSDAEYELSTGWRKANANGTRSSDSAFSVVSGAIRPYDRIRWKQGGGFRYGIVAQVAGNTVYLIPNTAFPVLSSPTTLTDIEFSRSENPAGLVREFSYVPSVATLTTPTISGTVVNYARFAQIASGILKVNCKVTFNVSGTANNRIWITLPYNPSQLEKQIGAGFLTVGGAREQLHVEVRAMGASESNVAIQKIGGSNFAIANSQVVELEILYSLGIAF